MLGFFLPPVVAGLGWIFGANYLELIPSFFLCPYCTCSNDLLYYEIRKIIKEMVATGMVSVLSVGTDWFSWFNCSIYLNKHGFGGFDF